MRVFRHYRNLPPAARCPVVALGNFDGLHKGHQAVIERARALADELHAPLGVMVFEPHPREFFSPQGPALRLMTLETKVRHLEQLGVEFVYALNFDYELSRKSAPDFVMDVLVKGLGAVHVVIGRDFFFGRERTGDSALLAYMGEMEGFGVEIIEAVTEDGPGKEKGGDGGEEYSSTRIREALRGGRPGEAAAMLGRWWCVEGIVREGEHRGRTLGFPTLNLELGRLLQPALGVYAVRVEVMDGPHKGHYDGVANVGRRPTFELADVLLEAHIFDFTGDLYGATVSAALVEFIRPEKKFDGADALKTQIAQDSAKAREILAAMPRAETPKARLVAGGKLDGFRAS